MKVSEITTVQSEAEYESENRISVSIEVEIRGCRKEREGTA